MTFPSPDPGLVVRYSYLWKEEAEAGREEGSKDRPCAVVMVITDVDGEQQVVVLPITHSPPVSPMDAIVIPAETKKRLQLDSDHSWIVIAEANEFIWPGPDLRPIPGRDVFTVAYGFLPPRFFNHVRDRFMERVRREKTSRIGRTE